MLPAKRKQPDSPETSEEANQRKAARNREKAVRAYRLRVFKSEGRLPNKSEFEKYTQDYDKKQQEKQSETPEEANQRKAARNRLGKAVRSYRSRFRKHNNGENPTDSQVEKYKQDYAKKKQQEKRSETSEEANQQLARYSEGGLGEELTQQRGFDVERPPQMIGQQSGAQDGPVSNALTQQAIAHRPNDPPQQQWPSWMDLTPLDSEAIAGLMQGWGAGDTALHAGLDDPTVAAMWSDSDPVSFDQDQDEPNFDEWLREDSLPRSSSPQSPGRGRDYLPGAPGIDQHKPGPSPTSQQHHNDDTQPGPSQTGRNQERQDQQSADENWDQMRWMRQIDRVGVDSLDQDQRGNAAHSGPWTQQPPSNTASTADRRAEVQRQAKERAADRQQREQEERDFSR